MASLLRRALDGYNFVFEDLADPRVKHFFLMSSPVPIMLLLVCYLIFVLHLGPRLMKNREPFNLDRIMIAYNAVQVVICFYMVVEYAIHILPRFSLLCEPIDWAPTELNIFVARHCWLYFILKVADLLDTVFFILRKKFSHLSFLHLYHHTGMILLSWIGTKFLAGGHGIFVGFINCIIHVIMYSYYLLAVWDKEYRKKVWWKKYLTQMQIAQFVIITVYFAQLLFQPNCTYPKWTVWVFLPQNLFMIGLFTNFYINAYVKPPTKPKVHHNNFVAPLDQNSGGCKVKSE